MKGFIIFEDFKKFINCKEILDGDYNCVISDYPNGTFSGIINRVTGAKCNKDDTYDFETGALIALMKMCGVEKVKKAAKETFFDVAENSVNEYEEEIKRLKDKNSRQFEYLKEKDEEIKKLRDENVDLECRKTCNETTIELLYNTINTLTGIDDKYKELKEEKEKFQHEYDLCKNSEHALKCSVDYLNKTIAKLNIANEAYRKENKMLCDKIKFLDKENRNLVYGGRQNGKQYTFLVEIFKKIDQKKVDAAYKEAYNTALPVWQREFLKEALSIYKPPTKREKMWNDILACGDCEHSKYVKVKKEDLEAFVKECNEKKIFSIIGYEFNPQSYWFADDRCIFQIFRKPAGFICAKSIGFASENAIIDYLPPMRWDLFKKGRIVVGCTEEEVPEFREKVVRELGNVRMEKYSVENLHCNGPIKVYFHYDKDTNWLKPLLVSGIPRVKVNNHKVYYWEDVR